MRYGYPEYVSVAQKRAKAAKQLKALKKKNSKIQPVVIEGRTIAHTWWGKSWNQNLERYADYSNRIGRGRSYVSHGAVLDLQIKPGKIEALVQGSRSKPYEIEIKIDPVKKDVWKSIQTSAQGQLDSLAELLEGQFPKSLQELFFSKDRGLFPKPQEIHFDCSCPDWASMCKHVAAALYGVGARLDQNPSLFFELRRIKTADLIAQAVKDTTKTLLKKAETRSARVMEDADIADVFGIQLDEEVTSVQGTATRKKQTSDKAKTATPSRAAKKPVRAKAAKSKKAHRTAAPKKKTISKPAVKRKTAVARGRTAAKATTRPSRAVQQVAAGGTMVDRVVAAVSPRRKGGISIAELCAKVDDLSATQVKNALARAVAEGRLRKLERGIYGR